MSSISVLRHLLLCNRKNLSLSSLPSNRRLICRSSMDSEADHHKKMKKSMASEGGVTLSQSKEVSCNPVTVVAAGTSMASGGGTFSRSIEVLGHPVTVVASPGLTESDLQNAVDSELFKQWLKNMQSESGILTSGEFSLREVHIQGVDMFGRRVGFLKFKTEVLDKQSGKTIPGIVFSRGPAVAILILLESDGETYAVLTEQARVPAGRFLLEIPAGMVDDDQGNIVGTAVREVTEETGLTLNVHDMVNLTSCLEPSTGRKVFPSPGGCDEDLSLFLYRGNIDKKEIESLKGKLTGLRDHGELIKVHVVPYKELWKVTADMKTLAAICLYEMSERVKTCALRKVA